MKTVADRKHLAELNEANRERLPGLAHKGGEAWAKKFRALKPSQQRAVVDRMSLARRTAALERRFGITIRMSLPARMFDGVDRRWARPPRRLGKPRKRPVTLESLPIHGGSVSVGRCQFQRQPVDGQ
jgi:hypothetical protein